MSKEILYLECYSGISGDMTVGALLDLGASRDKLKESLDLLGVEGYEIKIGRNEKSGIDACDFDVIIPEQPEYDEGHMKPDDGHGQEMSHDHSHDGGQAASDRNHHHGHDHSHHHVHRNINDVFKVIDKLENDHVKALSKKMFMIVAEAESKAHGQPIEEVHFHEVGAIDSIVDIISVAVCIDDLGIDDIFVSELYEGTGHVRCAHGLMPVPVPATLNIVTANDLTLKITDAQGEMVTPTGAAIAAALKNMDRLPAEYRIKRIGLGAGKKEFPKANILRAMILETDDVRTVGGVNMTGLRNADRKEDLSPEEYSVWKLECNVDDCTGEMLGYCMDRLFEAGARDVFFTPIFMKKNRPAYMLSVLCLEEKISELEKIIFRETTTIGIRRYPVQRSIMKRFRKTVTTVYGDVQMKISERDGIVTSVPEYESVKEICMKKGLPFKTVYQAACAALID